MNSYMFEFYGEFYGEAVNCFTFQSDMENEQITEFFHKLLQFYKPEFEEIFKEFCKTENINFLNFMSIKKYFSYADVKKRTSEICYDFPQHSDYDYHYVLYHNFGKWIQEDWNWKISFIAKKIKNYFTIIYQTDEFDDDDYFGRFQIIKNHQQIFIQQHNSDSKNKLPVINCKSKELFNMLIHIDEINNDLDAKKFCKR